MKKLTSIILLSLLLLASSCGPVDDGPHWWDDLEGDEAALQKAAYTGEVDQLDGVTLTLERADSHGGTFTMLNTTDRDIQYGSDFQVQRLVDGYWIPVPLTSDLDAWGLIAFPLPKDEEKELIFD